ncbi:kinetochore protein NDC80 homolog [Wyeomyia smithii]|uniref:kinetochore protein NDC80 homolog n=1 Tax=Wyeomyia smithii TaxID=174621 RepID=UPI002467D52E|nr:kinetochore protein NDC80 homolog [Wyeomyia smithii]
MSNVKRQTTMPRRTEEFDFSAPQSSMKKAPQRLSRIAQPVRKLSKASLGPQIYGENARPVSADKQNNFVQQTPATGGKARNPMSTPAFRTPLRSSENATSVPSTAEQNKVFENRDYMAAQCERICDYLETIPSLPQDFVERRNLKAMSTKQFLVIMTHLFRQIGGSRYKLGSNFLDDIMKTMSELEYPFTINKSMLKTPNVPHSISHIIVMIGWLVQLVPHTEQNLEPLKQDATLAEEFPNAEYQTFFYKKAEEGFSLWNLKKESEFEAIVEKLVDELVIARTKGLNQQQVSAKIIQLEKELQEINNRSVQQLHEQSMDGLAKTIEEHQQLKKKLSTELKSLQKEATKAEEKFYQNQEEFYVLMKKMEQLDLDVKSQQLSAEERDELMASIAANKNLLTAKRLAVSALEHTSFEHQIAVSRLIKQKFTLISNLNTRLHQFADSLKTMISFNAPTVDLKTENYVELLQDLHAIKSQVEAVLKQQSVLYGELSEQRMRLEQQMSDRQIQYNAIEKSLEEANTRYERLQQQRNEILNQLSSMSVETSQATHRKEAETVQMDKKITELQQQCEQNRKAIEKLNYDKRKLMHQKLEQCQEILAEKKRLQMKMTELVEKMEAEVACKERELDETDGNSR